ncbi:MAG: DUF6049 family protein [Acidimicrobiia bacterium]
MTLVAAIAPGLLHATPAGAGVEPSLTLTAQDPWTLVGGDVHMKLALDGADAGAGFTISVVSYSSIDSRSEFDRTLDGEELGSFLDQVVVPVDALSVDAQGNRDLAFRLEVSGGARLVETLRAPRAGVYPLEVELRDADDNTQAGFVTYLTTVAPLGSPDAVTSPLGVAWVWPLSAAPAILPGDGPDPVVEKQFAPDGRLGRQAAALDRASGVPMTIVPGPETVQSWAASVEHEQSLADGVSSIQRANGTHQMIAGTFVPVDLPSLLRAGMVAVVDTQIVEGNEALRRFFGTRLDTTTAVARPIDGAALQRLRAGSVDRLVVEEDALVARSSSSGGAQPFILEAPPSLVPASETTVSAIAADSGLARLLAADLAPALRAQRLLAGLSVVAFQDSDQARAVAILNSATLDPPDELIDAVLSGLRAHPLLRPVTVNDVFEQIPTETNDDGTNVTRELNPYDPPAPPVSAAAYDDVRLRLASFRESAPGAPGGEVADYSLLSSVSSAWSGPGGAERAALELASVDAAINAFLARIDVPNASTITLTDRSGDIPLTFRNGTGETVNVRIDLESPKLSFPDGLEQIVQLAPENTTVRLAVEARTSGSFPLRVTVRSPNGVLTIAQAQLEVQATEVSTVGLVLIISAAGFLALWWIIHIRRDRARRLVHTTADAE